MNTQPSARITSSSKKIVFSGYGSDEYSDDTYEDFGEEKDYTDAQDFDDGEEFEEDFDSIDINYEGPVDDEYSFD